MLRDHRGVPHSLPAYFALAVLSAVSGWLNAVPDPSVAVPAAVMVAAGAVALFAAGRIDDCLRGLLAALDWVRNAAGARTAEPPVPQSMEPIDSAAYLRVVSRSEPRAPVAAG